MTRSALLRASRESFAAGGLLAAWRQQLSAWQSSTPPEPGPSRQNCASLATASACTRERAPGANQQPPSPVANPAAILRDLFENLPPYPTPSTLRQVRQRLDEAGLGASVAQVLGPAQKHRTARDTTPNPDWRNDAEAILAAVTALLQRHASHPTDRFWARASLPELLLLLARLRIPSHPKLEVALVLLLRRGKLPTPSHEAWQDLAVLSGASRGTVRRRRGGRIELPPTPPLPTALRLAQAMAAVPVLSHEAWQQLAERHILVKTLPSASPSPASTWGSASAVALVLACSSSPLLEAASPDQLTVVAAAFARAGYHPVELFGAIADRLLRAVPHLQPGSLARALHAFAAVRHNDPTLAAALCEEIHRRMRGGDDGGGGGGGAVRGAAASGGPSSAMASGSTGGLLSLAGAALFGRGRRGGPDRAHRPPQFFLEDLARLATAAVHLGAGEAAARVQVYGGGEGGGGGGGSGMGDSLLAAVAEEAEEVMAQQVRRVVDAAAAAAAAGEAAMEEVQQQQQQQQQGLQQQQGSQAQEQLQRRPPEADRAGPFAASTVLTVLGGAGGSAPAGGRHGQRQAAGGEGRVGAVDVGADESGGEDEHGGVDGDGAAAHGWNALADEERLWPAGWPSGGPPGGEPPGGCSGSGWLSEQLEPVMALLGALVMGSAAGPFSPAARTAYGIAAQHLVPALGQLAPYLAPHHLVTLFVALLPGAAASLRLASHPYPNPQPPAPRWASPSTPRKAHLHSGGIDAGTAAGNTAAQRRSPNGDAPGDMLAAVAAVLSRGADPRTSSGARSLFAAWHALAAARAAGVPGADDPRVAGELMPAVFGAAVRHGPHLGSPTEAVRFVVSCALLSAFDRPALDAVTTPLVAVLWGGAGSSITGAVGAAAGGGGGYAARQQQRAHPSGGGGGAGSWGGSGRNGGGLAPVGLPAAGLAQLAWAVGQLGYGNEELLAALQSCAFALSATPASLLRGADGSSGDRLGHGSSQDRAPAGMVAWDGSSGGSGGGGSQTLLGPLELADVMWALAVNEFRTNGGADIRELYVRAALHGVVSIDDPRWLVLVRVHVLLLLGWAGGLGEATAGQLRGSWFNALGYAWERQAVDYGEQLAGPRGLPPDPDAAATAFRQSVAAAARELVRYGGADGGGSGGSSGGGRWRLQAGYVWGMLQPSSDIRLTVPLLARRQGRGGTGEVPGSSMRRRSWGGVGEAEWLVALDLVRRADVAEVASGGEAAAATPARTWPPPAAAQTTLMGGVGEEHNGGGIGGEEHGLPPQQCPGWESAEGREHQGLEQDRGKGVEIAQQQEQGRGRGQLQPAESASYVPVPGFAAPPVPVRSSHLLGPARWRHLVLRQLGVVVRPIRQEEWEQADGRERQSILQRALRVQV